MRSAAARLLALVFAIGPSPGHAVEGLFVWNDAAALVDGLPDAWPTDADAQRELLALCRSRGIRRVYLAVDPARWDGASLGRFLEAADGLAVGVYAVPPGEIQDRWVRPFRRRGACDHDTVLRWLDAVARFDTSPRRGRFSGIQLDIEPHAARGAWRPWGRQVWSDGNGGALLDPRNAQLAREYLRLLESVRDRLAAGGSDLRVAVTIPHWYDSEAAGFSLVYDGRRATLARHVQDRSDFVTVMNYRDGSAGRDVLWRDLEAMASRGPVESMFETAPPGRRRGAPRPDETLFEEGEAALDATCTLLDARLAKSGFYLGCAAHHWRHAIGGDARGWSKPDRR